MKTLILTNLLTAVIVISLAEGLLINQFYTGKVQAASVYDDPIVQAAASYKGK